MSTKKSEDLILSPLELAILLEATATRIRKSLEEGGERAECEIDRALDIAKRLDPFRPKRVSKKEAERRVRNLRKMIED